MSVDFDSSKQRWRVRWREQGRQRTRRFPAEQEALGFDESLRAHIEPAGSGACDRRARAGNAIYAYSARGGVRYRFAFRQSDGTLSTRRGFASRRDAATARRHPRYVGLPARASAVGSLRRPDVATSVGDGHAPSES